MEIIFLIVWLLLIIVSSSRLRRIRRVEEFRKWIMKEFVFTDAAYERRREVYNKISYDKMLNSWKKLEIESFYSPEEIEILMEGYKIKHP